MNTQADSEDARVLIANSGTKYSLHVIYVFGLSAIRD